MDEMVETDTRFYGKTFLSRIWSLSLWNQMLVDQTSYPSIYMHQWMFIKLNALFILYSREHAAMYDKISKEFTQAMLDSSLTEICRGCSKECDWCTFITNVIVPQVIKMGYYLSHFRFDRKLRLKSVKTVPKLTIDPSAHEPSDPPCLPSSSHRAESFRAVKRAGMKAN
jgi:hypothetical protein